jgi:hypothetical protein
MSMPPLLVRIGGYVIPAAAAFAVGFALARPAPPAPASPSSLLYTFNGTGTLEEAGSMGESTSPYFWLDSGGRLFIEGGVGATIEGDLPEDDKWRMLYAKSSATDTDDGAHPQNLFRLVTRSQWDDFTEEAGFFIVRDHLSESPNRNASNGLLLMSRYVDGSTLYYAGIRVDGTAVIKKKYHGTYYTMAEVKAFPGAYSGSRDTTNLLPHGVWISLKSETVTEANGAVSVTLSLRLPGEAWRTLVSATDDGTYGDTPPILGPAYAGIRTDFMDVEFRHYLLSKL